MGKKKVNPPPYRSGWAAIFTPQHKRTRLFTTKATVSMVQSVDVGGATVAANRTGWKTRKQEKRRKGQCPGYS